HTRFDCDWSSDVCSSDLASRSQLIEQCRNGIRKKHQHSGDNRGQSPLKPGDAKRLRVEAAQHLGPEIALQLCVLQGRERALEKRSEERRVGKGCRYGGWG